MIGRPPDNFFSGGDSGLPSDFTVIYNHYIINKIITFLYNKK